MDGEFSSFLDVLHRDQNLEKEEVALGRSRVSVIQEKCELAAVVVGKAVDAHDEVAKISRGWRSVLNQSSWRRRGVSTHRRRRKRVVLSSESLVLFEAKDVNGRHVAPAS
jgi:hypothetical protein